MGVYNGTHAYGIISAYGPSTDVLADTLQDTNHLYRNVYTAGTGSNQCDSFYSHTDTTADATAYDLTGIVDRFGATLTLTKVKALAIINKSATATITVTGNWFDVVFGSTFSFVIGAGGALIVEDPITGHTVTNGSADIIILTKSASLEHQLFIAGLD